MNKYTFTMKDLAEYEIFAATEDMATNQLIANNTDFHISDVLCLEETKMLWHSQSRSHPPGPSSNVRRP